MVYSGPTWKSVGTASETSPTWGTHAAGDLGILAVAHHASTLTTPTGWTVFANMPIDHPAFSANMTLYRRIATSGAEAAPSLAGDGNFMWGVINVYQDAHNSTPIHSLATMWRSASTTVTLPGITTLLDNCLIVGIYGWEIDNAGPLSSGETNASLGSIAERYDGGTITGSGGGIIVVDGTLENRATTMPIDKTQLTLSSSSAGCAAVFAIQKAGTTLPTLSRKTRAVNTRM